jgi:hypothetical protein
VVTEALDPQRTSMSDDRKAASVQVGRATFSRPIPEDPPGLLVTRSFVYGRIPCRRIPLGHGPPPR